jgi:endonuclease/exonuclease/phosphatase (EEP) superfamily protein YafD
MAPLSTFRGATAVAWSAVGVWALWALVRLLGLDWGFPLVPMFAFTPWMALASPLVVILAVFLGRPAAAAAGLLLVAVFAAIVLPRAFGGPTEPEGGAGPMLRILAANMKLGEGDPEALVELAERLDVQVLGVEELTVGLAKKLDRAGAKRLFPYRVLGPGPNSTGSGLYSAVPLARGFQTRLPGGFPLIARTPRIPGAAAVELLDVHVLAPTISGTRHWSDDLEALPLSSPALPRIMFGDFNATLDQGDFRDVVDQGYNDVAETLGDGLTMTWPTNRAFPPLVAIDHVLAGEGIGIRDFSAHEIPDSDHRAVFAELELPPA